MRAMGCEVGVCYSLGPYGGSGGLLLLDRYRLVMSAGFPCLTRKSKMSNKTDVFLGLLGFGKSF